MQNIKYRFIIVVLVFIFFGILINLYGIDDYKASKKENILDAFPSNIGDWKGQRIPMSDSIYRILETENVYVSKYENNTNQITLSIVYYPEVKVDFHSPEGCSSSNGDSVEKIGYRRIVFNHGGIKRSIVLNGFIVHKKNGGKILYAYYYKTEKGLYSNYVDFRINLAMEYLINKKTSGALITLSTPIGNNIMDSEGIINEFVVLAHPNIMKYI